MKLEKEDEILGAVAISLIERKGGECPSDEEFALYLDRKLNRERKKTLISHFISCPACRDRLAVSNLALETAREENILEKLLTFFGRPLVIAPVAIVILFLAAITLNVYLKSSNFPDTEERYRGGDLVSVNQVDLTPGLLRIIQEGDQGELKNNLAKELPPHSEVSDIVVEERLKSLKDLKENEKITLILYSDGLLKVKLTQ
ncbi:MAG TPA: hypothetical protein VNN20_14265 [Thermodesulfobacteriota bacterium]|nr:hypothetical protein [Thermodesulfobacteriota bacterium]